MRSFSGKFVLRVTPLLHKKLREEAADHGLSLNEWIVRQMSGRSSHLPLPILDRLLKIYGADLMGVVQFGSSVRGEMRASSDIDLLLVINPTREVDRSLYQEWDRSFPEEKYQIYSPQFSHPPTAPNFSSLWLEIGVEGEILFDSNGKIATVLRAIREAIASGLYTRKISHGHPYWVRKDENAK